MNINEITKFEGQYYFLSNFYECRIVYDNIVFSNSEAAFQAVKCVDRHDRFQFSVLNPSQAKSLGRKVKLRKDWEIVKDEIMLDIVRTKFAQNQDLAIKLLKTENLYLEERNWRGDTYWGVCKDKGLNKLGYILMKVRSELNMNNAKLDF